jgi:phosphoribosyl 1,2-cyclic phosphate phosphodiesterase
MKVTILGSGSSGGVPNLMGYWGQCDPHHPRNRRRRSSILLEDKGRRILVDTSPDIREQMLSIHSPSLDAIILTHAHYDHIGGLDELRGVSFAQQRPISVYSNQLTLDYVNQNHSYLLGQAKQELSAHPKVIDVFPLNLDEKNFIADFEVTPFTQDHGLGMVSLGLKMGRFAYSTDLHEISDQNYETLQGVTTWIVDCIGLQPAPTHSHLEQTLRWIHRLKPERAILTHLGPSIDYESVNKLLPRHVELAYDGMTLDV